MIVLNQKKNVRKHQSTNMSSYMSSSRNRVTRVFLFLSGGIVVIMLGLAVTFWFKSPGTADPITCVNGKTLPGSISVIEKVVIGGQEQVLIIRGADRTKPVMLYLHGGPGSPEFAYLKKMNRAIEKDFVMVYWEQRGAGKSWSKEVPAKSMNLPQLISDTRQLSLMLAKRFKKDKIYLMGHSWGSLLGILTAYHYPGLYYAYFGTGQVCSQYSAEKTGYEWVMKQAISNQDRHVISVLSKMPVPDSLANVAAWIDYISVERNFVAQFGGGVLHDRKGMMKLVKMIINTPEYTVSEKLNFVKSGLFSVRYLWPSVIRSNLFQEIDTMRIPVYIFQGKYDYQTPGVLVKSFFDRLKAPKKEFYIFEHSAHSPMLEEPERFNSIVRGIIQRQEIGE